MKKILLTIVLVLGFANSANASSKSGCVLAQKGNVTVAWTAYKTASKIGVSGTFDKVDYKAVAKEPRTGTITVEITINGTTKQVPLNYTYDKETMKSEGYIDILDFGGAEALSSINKACFDLHKGKTWSDVLIGFEMNIKAILCATKK
jgi:polyisoprenoid-binding protein YceI